MSASVTPDPSVHGGDGLRLAIEMGIDPSSMLDLSASLCPVAPDPSSVVAFHLDALGRYPDVTVASSALAEIMGVERDHLLLTSGGAEAIALTAQRLGGSVKEPDFSLYPRGDGPLWRSNPNNPLGSFAAPDERAAVWDEAFWPLATGTWTRGDYRDGAVVLGSLTKLLACPGLRIGYVLCADDELMADLRRYQPHWSVNGLAAEALPDLLAAVDLPAWAYAIDELRGRLVSLLVAHGLAVRFGRGPWVLVDDAEGLRDRLLGQGVVVRDCASFGLENTVRIAVPRAEHFARLADALQTSIS